MRARNAECCRVLMGFLQVSVTYWSIPFTPFTSIHPIVFAAVGGLTYLLSYPPTALSPSPISSLMLPFAAVTCLLIPGAQGQGSGPTEQSHRWTNQLTTTEGRHPLRRLSRRRSSGDTPSRYQHTISIPTYPQYHCIVY